MHVCWKYDYTLGVLYQHSAKLTDQFVISPFFVLDLASGKCLWEEPGSMIRSPMLVPRALAEDVIVAEKFESTAGHLRCDGIYRFDLQTGAALSVVAITPRSFSLARIATGLIPPLKRPNVFRHIPLYTQKLRTVDGSRIFTESGAIIDARSGSVVGIIGKRSADVPALSPGLTPNGNASSVEIPGIGQLCAGLRPESGHPTVGGQRFVNDWPLRFHLRDSGRTVWEYDDQDSRRSGLTGSFTYDRLAPPYAYFLLYKLAPAPDQPSNREFAHDIVLRTLDLRNGQITHRFQIAGGPAQKWPSIVDADEKSVLVLSRDANSNVSTLTCLKAI